MAVTTEERDAIAAICLFAAFADDGQDESERQHIRDAMAGLTGSPNLAALAHVHQRVLLKRTSLRDEAAKLSTPELRQLAYEMAVAVCDADGATSAPERALLSELAAALGLNAGPAAQVVEHADTLADQPVDFFEGARPGTPAPLAPSPQPAAPVAAATPTALDAEIDASIQRNAILCGALELLSQPIATMAIIPLQMRMVYGIGKRYGYTLDRGHIKDFLGVVGVGATSQVVESFARRLMGGLVGTLGKAALGKTVGKLAGGAAQTATGAAFSFASTYALGQVARQYYAGGRTMAAVDLKRIFSQQVTRAQDLYEQVRPQIEQRARTVNPSELMSIVRSGT
jgi:uncharacterized protein (DUF697 family)/tellurite resistance protein